MNKFFDALTTKNLLTENGMPTHSSSGDFLVDFFYKMGGYRKDRSPLSELIGIFYASYGQHPVETVKALFNLRDPRGGMGERRSGRILWHSFAKTHPEVVKKLLQYIPAFGRWDDLFYFLGTPLEDEAMDFLLQAILSGDGLAAKWTVREGKKGPEEFQKGAIAAYLMKRWELSPQKYRYLLSRNTKVVETLMCQGNWEGIVFEHIPGNAMKKYRNAFKKHQAERFSAYLDAVNRGEKKIHTATLNPVDIVHEYLSVTSYGMYQRVGLDKALETLWSKLPDVVPDGISFLPICDLSGSMWGQPIEVSISLGIYLSQRNKSIFKNGFITFSRKPSFVYLTGKTLLDNLNIMRGINMAENTNLEATFDLILSSAVRANLPPEEMPTHLMIISDMQFDHCTGNPSLTALEMIRQKYQRAGYEMPKIFFWNVSTATGVPAKINDKGVGLISGYSPNLLLNVLRGDLSPLAQVLAILNVERYAFVEKVLT